MESSHRFFSLFKALILTYILTAVSLILLAFALYRFHLTEPQINFGVRAIYVISCLIGGFVSGKLIRQRRFFWGALLGFLYMGILILASFAINHVFPDTPQILLYLSLCSASASIGGILS